ncbi:MAG: methionine--tRNA ligase [Pseudomonadota bacterium]
MRRFYATTPIYYVNGRPHIGHAYCTIVADAARRYAQLMGSETYFVTGTDEHGQKVQEAAEKRGIPAQQHVDELHRAFLELWPELHCHPDQFIRTTEPRHVRVVQRALSQLWEQGLIEARDFEGWYSTTAERFWTEKDLIDGRCPDTGGEVVLLKERNYFFLMSRYQQQLIDAIESDTMQILPHNRRNEVLGFLREPLQDLCISRPKSRLQWGIELPFDADFVCYVWFDALLNYVTAVGGIGAQDDNERLLPGRLAPPRAEGEGSFEHWWPSVCHFLGKDILTTHAVYWPTMLMALGLPLPRRLVVTGWWLQNDTKMSKSLGNVVDPLAVGRAHGKEVMRYFLLREMAVGQDANFSEEALLRRNNTELANDLGNLVQRTTALVHRNWGGTIPAPDGKSLSPMLASARALGRYLAGQAETAEAADAGQAVPLPQSLEEMKLHVAVADAMSLVGRLNAVLASDQPFKLVKTDPAAAATVVYHVLEGIRFAANLLWPVMPQTCETICKRIGATGGIVPWSELQWGDLPVGAEVPTGDPLFPKLEPTATVAAPKGVPAAAKDAAKTGPKAVPAPATSTPAETTPLKELVGYETFAALDIRVGIVRVAEPVPKSKKLLRLEVDLGGLGMRQILAGVAQSLTPEQLVGTRVQILANLAPRKLMGLESQGMMMLAEGPDGRLLPMRPDGDAPAGATIN